jgi:hypothetical protein
MPAWHGTSDHGRHLPPLMNGQAAVGYEYRSSAGIRSGAGSGGADEGLRFAQPD